MSDNPNPARTQRVYDPKTDQTKEFKVRSIKHRFTKGKGGAIKARLGKSEQPPAKPAKPGVEKPGK